MNGAKVLVWLVALYVVERVALARVAVGRCEINGNLETDLCAAKNVIKEADSLLDDDVL